MKVLVTIKNAFHVITLVFDESSKGLVFDLFVSTWVSLKKYDVTGMFIVLVTIKDDKELVLQ